MSFTNPFLFVSYARVNHQIVYEITDALKKEGVDTWIDIEQLKPGQLWENRIQDALSEASGLLVFVSRASMESSFVREEIEIILARTELVNNIPTHELLQHNDLPSLIIPIILEQVPEIPKKLSRHQWIDLSESRDSESINKAVSDIAFAVKEHTADPTQYTKIDPEKAQEAATEIAKEVRSGPGSSSTMGPPDSVFVVHGKDMPMLQEVEEFIIARGIKPIVLTKIGGRAQSLFQKFLKWSENVRFAVVLISADDVGASLRKYKAKEGGVKTLQFRARQNVIYELGYFYGTLGWENVFVVFRPSDKEWPTFKFPSDLDGVIFDEFKPNGEWRVELTKKLKEAGFIIKD